MSGADNMRFDEAMLNGVGRRLAPPTLRFFYFDQPTVSYGRLQKIDAIQSLIPRGWSAVQRPTGGGLVFHEKDLCLSLCWPRELASPLPYRARDQYRWIHGIILESMGARYRMAACGDPKAMATPFEVRDCFTNPVGYDLMNGNQKVVGGALLFQKEAILY